MLSLAQLLARTLSLVLLAMLGTVFLMRSAPGYFSEERELDARFSVDAEDQIQTESGRQESSLRLWAKSLRNMVSGNFGTSRQYGAPVRELLVPRLRVTGKLLAQGVSVGLVGALLAALWCSGVRSRGVQRLLFLLTALGICVPVSVLATASMLHGKGSPALVLSAIVGARDFRFLTRLLRRARTSPHLLYARACGLRPARIAVLHLLLPISRDLRAIIGMSGVVALGAIIPIEVVCDTAGAGQLAWSAAMNRDLPVLFAVTAVLATCIAVLMLMAQHSGRVTEAR